ncbi:MAG: hypothetical protein KAU17_09445 [Spirochaetales bacterium]|nr:hypothetical protein [Spirochaetales bacterium]
MKGRIRKIALTEDPHELFLALVSTFAFGVIFGVRLYGEQFLSSKYPYSSLGAVRTAMGFPNFWARFVFNAALLLCGLLLFRISFWYHRNDQNSNLKQFFALLGAMGAFLMMIPCDVNNFYHSIGASTFVGSIWIFTNLVLIKMCEGFSFPIYLIGNLVTQGSVLPYAWTFLINDPSKQVFQKITTWGLISVLIVSHLVCMRRRKTKEEGTKEILSPD